ncbi:MAG: hypothetical protein H6622_12325 [Halobacteriovoraceae bacterium]|nr:hypothetical protein [Halobacteriovoraceae bacterium]
MFDFSFFQKNSIFELSETELKKALEEVSAKFTSQRSEIGDYTASSKLVSAYNQFYVPTNIPKFNFLISQINDQKYLEEFLSKPVIDIGSGPGTYLLAWYEYCCHLKIEFPEMCAVDTSHLMLEQLNKNFSKLKIKPTTFKYIPKKHFYNVIFGNSINEMSRENVESIIDEITPQNIFIVEPGTKESFKKVLGIRNWLLSKNYSIVYPCPHSLECPLSVGENWCHQVLKTSHDNQLERLSQLIKKDRRNMPLIGQIYSKVKEKHTSFQVIRILLETKFSFEFEVCTNSGGIEIFEVQKRTLSKEQIKSIRMLSWGVKLEFKKIKILGEKRHRVCLINF